LIAVLGAVSSVYFLKSVEREEIFFTETASSFSIDDFDDQEALVLLKETQLLPNDSIIIFDEDGRKIDTYNVEKVVFSRKCKVSIQLKSNILLKGRLLNPSSTILTRQWEKSRSPLAIQTEKGVKNLNFKEIGFIRGEQKLILNKPVGDIEPSNCRISVYQSQAQFLSDSNRTERSRWTSSVTDENSSIYDLFTPPIIYLVDGALSTALPKPPEEIKEEEPFGLSLISFDKEVYRFKMSGWIGKTPYFEDLQTKVSLNSPKNVRNRVEINKPYKLNPDYKPGGSTLIQTTIEDDKKLLVVKYFAVQQIPNAKTGGLKSVGRALVEDFQIGGEPFEINSLMEEVFPGQFSINLKFEVPGAPSQEISISEKDIGKRIIIDNRIYEILQIDSNAKELVIQKTGSAAGNVEKATLGAL
jgi:hypothetical protein